MTYLRFYPYYKKFYWLPGSMKIIFDSTTIFNISHTQNKTNQKKSSTVKEGTQEEHASHFNISFTF